MEGREAGAVFAYPYLWNAEAERTDNPKDRTTCLAILKRTTRDDGKAVVHLFLLGISDRPRPRQEAVEIPDIEKRRAGLDPMRPAFIVISEYNYDVLPSSWWYDPNSRDFGRFSPVFLADVTRRFLLRMSARRVARADRTQ